VEVQCVAGGVGTEFVELRACYLDELQFKIIS
jgi:hypothetical protein